MITTTMASAIIDTDLHRTLLLCRKHDKALDLHEGNFQTIFDNSPSILTTPAETASDYVENVTNQVSKHSDQSEMLVVGIAALHAYIQANITGPKLELDLELQKNDRFLQDCVDQLGDSGENSFRLQSHPYLLLLAIAVLEKLSTGDGQQSQLSAFAKWWYSRALVIRQSTLTGESSTIHDAIFASLTNDTLLSVLGQGEATPEIAKDLTIQFHCETARACLVYDDVHKADKSLDMAQKMSQLKYCLTGATGRRSKNQIRDTALLVFVAKSAEAKDVSDVADSETVPSSLQLESDSLMEKPEYVGKEEHIPEELQDVDLNNQPALQDIDTSIILLRAARTRQSNPHKAVLIQEELTAMVNRIIHSPTSTVNWCLFSRALWMRSLLEADAVKTVERGTLQIQSLVEELGYSNSTFFPKPQEEDELARGKLASRLQHIHQLLPLPKWSMDVELAERFMAFGALKSALEVYERLELWSEVALCYASVGQEDEGLVILDKYLENHPNDARGWAIKGDILVDPQYWEKSWEVGKYAAAKRSLGRYYYSPPPSSGLERDVDAAIKHLNDSLQVNPLNYNAWFLYGCAGLETEQFELAAEAFSRCVAIEEDGPKAWSNLATALLRLDKKQQAFGALKQAVKPATDNKNWRIWTNYITVAADLAEWSEVIRGLNEIIKIRGEKEGETAVDMDMIERVVQILIHDEYNPQQQPLNHFQKSAIALLTETIPNLITADHNLWKIVAKVNIWLKRPWTALECHEKLYRIISQHVEVDEKHWDEAVEACSDLVDAYINFGPREGRIEGSTVCPDWKFKAKSVVRSLIGKGKALWQDTDGWDRLQQIKQEVADA